MTHRIFRMFQKKALYVPIVSGIPIIAASITSSVCFLIYLFGASVVSANAAAISPIACIVASSLMLFSLLTLCAASKDYNHGWLKAAEVAAACIGVCGIVVGALSVAGIIPALAATITSVVFGALSCVVGIILGTSAALLLLSKAPAEEQKVEPIGSSSGGSSLGGTGAAVGCEPSSVLEESAAETEQTPPYRPKYAGVSV